VQLCGVKTYDFGRNRSVPWFVFPLTRCAVVVRSELFFGVLDVVTVGSHHVLGQRDGTGVPLGFIGVRVDPGVCLDSALSKVLIGSPVRAWVHVTLPSEVAAASTGSGTKRNLHPRRLEIQCRFHDGTIRRSPPSTQPVGLKAATTTGPPEGGHYDQTTVLADIRYALRSLRRSPLFAASVISTIGLGLGVLCSGFTILNAYVLKPIDLPEPHTLYELSWDTTAVRRHRFTLDDFEALRDTTPHFSTIAAGSETRVMQDGVPMAGLLVSGDFFQVLRLQPAVGRTLIPADAAAPGQGSVVVLSNDVWRARYGGDPAIVGKTIVLRQQRFDVVGVLPRGFSLPGQEMVAFYAPLTMASAFDVPNPWKEASPPSLLTFGRLTGGATESQARAWFDVWLHQRFRAGSESTPIAVRVEPRGTRIPLDGVILSMVLLIMSIFALVLLVACANVTNLVLARGFARQREIAVRLSLGARRGLVIRQLMIESLVLAVPAAALGLALTMVTVRVFPPLITATFPLRAIPFEVLLAPLDPDWRVLTVLAIAAVISAVLVSLMPALHVTRANLVRASKGDEALDARRSRLRTALVALQIGACVLFLVAAVGFIDRSTQIANPDTNRNYERVADVRMAPRLRATVVARLAGDPAVEQIAAAWRPPMTATLQPLDVLASETRIQQTVGFTVVSSEYFPVFGIRIVRGDVHGV
jgi:predicted permease